MSSAVICCSVRTVSNAPRLRRTEAPARLASRPLLMMRHTTLLAPARYTSVPERHGEGQSDNLDTRKVHQMADATDAQPGGEVTSEPKQVNRESTGRPNDLADAQPASTVTTPPAEAPGEPASTSIDEERMPGYHHESREDLARKGAAVHEEIFPRREQQGQQ